MSISEVKSRISGKEVLIICHQDDESLNSVRQYFADFGGAVRTVFRDQELGERDAGDASLVVHLGSDWSAVGQLQDRRVLGEIRIIKQSLEQSRPTIGICFGAQLLALASGGSVYKLRNPEVGWSTITSSVSSAILGGEWFQWHFDYIVPSSTQTVIAHNATCPQALVEGRSVGFQFHPEINVAVLEQWVQNTSLYELQSFGIQKTRIIEESAVRLANNLPRFSKLMDWTISQILEP